MRCSAFSRFVGLLIFFTLANGQDLQVFASTAANSGGETLFEEGSLELQAQMPVQNAVTRNALNIPEWGDISGAWYSVGGNDTCVARRITMLTWESSLACGGIFAQGAALCFGGGSQGTLVALGFGGAGNFAYKNESAGDAWYPGFILGGSNFLGDIEHAACTYSPRLGRFVATGTSAGGGQNGLAYSDDRGRSWIGLGFPVFESGARGLVWADPYFYAVGEGLTQSVARSVDGENWSAVGGNPVPGLSRGDIDYQIEFRTLVLVGGPNSGPVRRSTDLGLSWSRDSAETNASAVRVALLDYLPRSYLIGEDAQYYFNFLFLTPYGSYPYGGPGPYPTQGRGVAVSRSWRLDNYSPVPAVVKGNALTSEAFTWQESTVMSNSLYVIQGAQLRLAQPGLHLVDVLNVRGNVSFTFEQGAVLRASSIFVVSSGPLQAQPKVQLVVTEAIPIMQTQLSVILVNQTDGPAADLFNLMNSTNELSVVYEGPGSCSPIFSNISVSLPTTREIWIRADVTPCIPVTTVPATGPPTTEFVCPPQAVNCSCSGSMCSIESYNVGSSTFAVPAGTTISFLETWTCTPESTVQIGFRPSAESDGPVLRVEEKAILAGTLRLQLEPLLKRGMVSSRMTTTTVVSVVEAGSVEGSFDSVVATSEDPCESVALADQSQTGTTLSVTVTSTNTCDSGGGGLSSGAIIGIAVGAAVVGVALGLLVVLLLVRQRKKRLAVFKATRSTRATSDFVPLSSGSNLAENPRETIVL